MSSIERILSEGHEQLSIFQAQEVGLTAIVSIHNTRIGPALGGCRMRQYQNLDEALFDALRLSEGMTYKNALCGINFGGGKSVIVADRNLTTGRKELFQKFGTFVNSLGGSYITAEDMGTSVSDMSEILKTCPYVAGRDQASGGGGDPSPFTARGVFEGMRACLKHVFGSSDFLGRHVAIQGVGHVGYYLATYLKEAGAKVTIADTREEVARQVAESLHVELVSSDVILSLPCDILSPCAVGAVINDQSVKSLQCRIIAGAANNQLLGQSVVSELTKKGIVYAPDFAINAGGVILCADEFEPGGFTESRVLERVKNIYGTIDKILSESKSKTLFTEVIALEMAKERILKSKR